MSELIDLIHQLLAKFEYLGKDGVKAIIDELAKKIDKDTIDYNKETNELKIKDEVLNPVIIPNEGNPGQVLVKTEDGAEWEDKEYNKDITPYPEGNQVIYTTTDGNPIEITSNDIISNIYYKDRGFGIVTFKTNNITWNFPNINNLKTLTFSRNSNSLRIYSPNCPNLEKIDNPVDVDTIFYNYAFNGCTRLSKINFPNKVNPNQGTIFENTNITEINIPTTWDTIPSGYLLNTNISHLFIPPNIKTVKDICHCKQLISLTIPSTVSVIGGLWGCYNLVDITFIGASTGATCDWLTPNNTFRDCHSLKRLILPKCEGNKLGVQIFCNCYSLEELRLPSNITDLVNLQTFMHVNNLKIFETYAPSLESGPSPNKLETLILRSSTLIEDVEEYVTTFTLEEGQELPKGAIQSRINLDQYIGTPNSWLKIYVPNNLLKAYKDRYPTLKNHFHPITGEDTYMYKDNFWTGTQEEYDAIETKDPNVFYFIKED